MSLSGARAVLLALVAAASSLAETRALTILHTNDLHSRITPSDQGLGGFAHLATAIRQERAGCKECVLLNAGDLAQGSPVSTIFHGLPIYEIANKLGFDAATLGNHEFDYGWMQARKFISTAKYPIVTANIVNDAGQLFTPKAYVVLKVNGLRVAVLGAMTEELKNLTTPKQRGPWNTTALLDTVRRYAREAQREADFIVLLAHVTMREELELLDSVQEVNVVISGHLHNGFEAPVMRGNRMLVRVKGDTEELGRLELQVDRARKAAVSSKWKRIPIEAARIAPAPEVAALVKKWNDEVTRRVDQPLARSARPFDKPAVRELVHRAMREQTGADFAFVNMGGVRDSLPAGQLLVRHIWNVMPFDNMVVFGTFKGKQLPTVVVNGRQVEPEREYTLAVTDFTAANQGARSQLQTKGLEFPGEGPLLRDLLIDWFRKKQVIE